MYWTIFAYFKYNKNDRLSCFSVSVKNISRQMRMLKKISENERILFYWNTKMIEVVWQIKLRHKWIDKHWHIFSHRCVLISIFTIVKSWLIWFYNTLRCEFFDHIIIIHHFYFRTTKSRNIKQGKFSIHDLAHRYHMKFKTRRSATSLFVWV